MAEDPASTWKQIFTPASLLETSKSFFFLPGRRRAPLPSFLKKYADVAAA